jgi:hypothetical protein
MEIQYESKGDIVVELEKICGESPTRSESKVIGFVVFFGKLNAIVVKSNQVELQETDIERFDSGE